MWLNREKHITPRLEARRQEKMERLLGPVGLSAYAKGFSIIDISVVPPELPLEKLNRRLGKKGYFALPCPDKSLINGTMYCALNVFGTHPSAQRIEAEIQLRIETLDGNVVWAHRETGAVRRRESVSEEEGKRAAALAAINAMSLLHLPDGRALKEKGYSLAKVENDMRVRQAMEQQNLERRQRQLQAQIENHVMEQWIMSNRLVMKSGKKRDVIVLQKTPTALSVMTDNGRKMVPAKNVRKIVPFNEKMYSERVRRAIKPLREGFIADWEHQACEKPIRTMGAMFATYGPAYPEARVISLMSGGTPGPSRAKIMTEEGELELEIGDRISGFEVIGMDDKTSTVLLRWGEGGETVRIWPEPAMP
jgi:hypothetical protein